MQSSVSNDRRVIHSGKMTRNEENNTEQGRSSADFVQLPVLFAHSFACEFLRLEDVSPHMKSLLGLILLSVINYCDDGSI